jgi:hypothetical protein
MGSCCEYLSVNPLVWRLNSADDHHIRGQMKWQKTNEKQSHLAGATFLPGSDSLDAFSRQPRVNDMHTVFLSNFTNIYKNQVEPRLRFNRDV